MVGSVLPAGELEITGLVKDPVSVRPTASIDGFPLTKYVGK